MSNSTLHDDIWNAVLKDALLEMAQEDQRVVDSIVEKQPEFNQSKRYRKNMHKIITKSESLPPKMYINRFALRAVPVLALLLVALLATLYVAAESQGVSLWRYIFNVQEEYTQIELTTDLKENLIKNQVNFNLYIPKDIPNGYVISNIETMDTLCSITFSNGDQEIEFTQDRIMSGTHQTVDTENATYSVLDINGQSCFYLEKNGKKKLFFHNDSHSFSFLATDISQKQLVRIAESLQFIQK